MRYLTKLPNVVRAVIMATSVEAASACSGAKGECLVAIEEVTYFEITYKACQKHCVDSGASENSCPWKVTPSLTGPSV